MKAEQVTTGRGFIADRVRRRSQARGQPLRADHGSRCRRAAGVDVPLGDEVRGANRQDAGNGVQLSKPIPGLDDLLARAVDKGIFGTKEHATGIAAIVAQQFDVARQVLAHDIVPILEPEVTMTIGRQGAGRADPARRAHGPSRQRPRRPARQAEALAADRGEPLSITHPPSEGDARRGALRWILS